MFLDAEGPEIDPPTPGRPDPGVRDHHVFLDAEGPEINPPTPGRPDPGVRDHHVFLDARGPEINPATQSRFDPGVRAEGPPNTTRSLGPSLDRFWPQRVRKLIRRPRSPHVSLDAKGPEIDPPTPTGF